MQGKFCRGTGILPSRMPYLPAFSAAPRRCRAWFAAARKVFRPARFPRLQLLFPKSSSILFGNPVCAFSVTGLALLCKLLISKRAHSTPCCVQECVSQPLPKKSLQSKSFLGAPISCRREKLQSVSPILLCGLMLSDGVRDSGGNLCATKKIFVRIDKKCWGEFPSPPTFMIEPNLSVPKFFGTLG